MSAANSNTVKVLCALCVAVSGYVFSQRSITNLNEVDPKLQAVATCALQHSPVDFVVVDGGRTPEEHQSNLANGKSWIKRSKHQDGLAIDVAAYIKGKITYDPLPYYDIAKSFKFCSTELNTPITWGGDWRVKDLMHFELR
jgi:hypothetical protein